MSFKLNLITISMIAMSSPVMAANFAVGNVNMDSVNTKNYECNRCISSAEYQGEVMLAAGYNDINDINNTHAANALGTDHNGGIAAVSGNIKYQGESGYEAKIQTYQLIMDNGFAHLSGGQSAYVTKYVDCTFIEREKINNNGFEYELNYLKFSGNNSLLRKYYVIYRVRNAIKFNMVYHQANQIVLDINSSYTNDEYDNIKIGLTESEYYVNLNVKFIQHIDNYMFDNQQWFHSNQSFNSLYFKGDIEGERIDVNSDSNCLGLIPEADYIF